MRTVCILGAMLVSWVCHAQASTVSVEVDTALMGAAVRDLFGVNRKPSFSDRTSSVSWNAASLYSAFGVSQVLLHDSQLDLCTTYTAASKVNAGVSPEVAVAGCTLTGERAPPHFKWTPISSADDDLNNPENYDFTAVDEALRGAMASGAGICLRLGESYNGPNDTGDAVAWAKVATNIYKHVLGVFKPSAGIALDPVFVQVHNEPDGIFWSGETATFNTLYVETVQRVRTAAAEAGKAVTIGGSGFTTNILANSTVPENPANGFIDAVDATNLDFYSAHHYNNCSSASLASAASFLRSLRSLVDNQGGSGKPLHITEWNIGLGERCGNPFFGEQRTQSFASGMLTLMQDPAQNIAAAFFYAGVPIMSLFDPNSVAGAMRINPSAWALLAHSRLRGSNTLSAQVCPATGACVAGYAAETQPLLALAAQTGSSQTIIVTNDGTAEVSYTLRVKGLTASSANVTINTPPAGVHDVGVSGSPSTVNAGELAALLASVAQDTRSNLTVSDGQIELTATLPARSVQWVNVNPVLTVPAAPSITSVARGANSATIHFSGNSDGGATISGYLASCTAAGQSPATASGLASPITVNGLVRNVAYSCSLVAQNAIGSSAASASYPVAARPANLAPMMMLLLD